MAEFWEDIALDLLEKNLNGHSLNADSLKELFKERLKAAELTAGHDRSARLQAGGRCTLRFPSLSESVALVCVSRRRRRIAAVSASVD